jgi:hypothetical protein
MGIPDYLKFMKNLLRILAVLFCSTLFASAALPPVVRNAWSTNLPGATISATNNVRLYPPSYNNVPLIVYDNTVVGSLIVQSNGNVGIGEINPLFALEISDANGQIRLNGTNAASWIIGHMAAPVNSKYIELRSKDSRGALSSMNDIGTYNKEGIITWDNTNGNVWMLGQVSGLVGTNGSNYVTLTQLQNSNYVLMLGGGSTNQILLNPTLTNAAIVAKAYNFNPLAVKAQFATDAFMVLSNGNVGISNQFPTAILHVGGGVEANSKSSGLFTGPRTLFGGLGGLYMNQITALDTTATALGVGGGINFMGAYNVGGDQTWFSSIAGIKENGTGGNYSGALIFNVRSNTLAALERMRLTSAGFLGVGVANPLVPIHVWGSGIFSNNVVDSDVLISYVNDAQRWVEGVYGSALDDFRIYDLGNTRVAIGAAAANGVVYIPNGLHSTNSIGCTVLGYQAAAPGQVTNGVAIGYQAGNGTLVCKEAVFVGYQAGLLAKNCTDGVFVGDFAGYWATNCVNTVINGAAAGLLAMSSSNSVFVGFAAGQNATNCAFSTFLGMNAGWPSSGADHSVFIGYNAGTNTVRPNTLLIDTAGQGTNALIYGEFDNKLIRINGVIEVTNGLFVNAFSNGVAPPTVVKQPIGLFATLTCDITNSFTANAVYTPLTNYTGVITNGFTARAGWAGGFLTNQTAGFYRVDFSASMLPGNNEILELELFFNETGHEETAVYGHFDTVARVRTLTSSGIHWLPANTGVSLRVKNTAASAIAVWRAGLSIGTP